MSLGRGKINFTNELEAGGVGNRRNQNMGGRTNYWAR